MFGAPFKTSNYENSFDPPILYYGFNKNICTQDWFATWTPSPTDTLSKGFHFDKAFTEAHLKVKQCKYNYSFNDIIPLEW